jgi:hypothetical protein
MCVNNELLLQYSYYIKIILLVSSVVFLDLFYLLGYVQKEIL